MKKNSSRTMGRRLRYLLLPIVIVTATALLVALGQGYVYNPSTGEVEDGSLLLIDSRPEDAAITIDGEVRATTPEQLLLPAGRYEVALERQNYRRWQKELQFSGQAVTRAQYPVLIPNELHTEQLAAIGDALALSAQSPNRRTLALAGQRLWLLRAGNARPDSLALPADMGKIEQLSWSPDSRYLLLKSTERWYLLSPDNPADRFALHELFNINGGEVRFGRTWNELFVLAGGRLRRLEVQSRTTTVLDTNISAFASLDDGRVLAVESRGPARRLLAINGAENINAIRQLLPNHDYGLDSLNYEDQRQALLHDRTQAQITLLDANKDWQTLSLPPRLAGSFTLSPEERFVVMRSGLFFLTYDLENEQSYAFTLPDLAARLEWFGDFHLLAVRGNAAVMFEFDGGNLEPLASAAGDLGVFGFERQAFILSLRPGQGQTELLRTNLE